MVKVRDDQPLNPDGSVNLDHWMDHLQLDVKLTDPVRVRAAVDLAAELEKRAEAEKKEKNEEEQRERERIEAEQKQQAEQEQTESENVSVNTYTVQAGDNLYRIALKHNMTTEELKAKNGISGNEISVGQVLKVN